MWSIMAEIDLEKVIKLETTTVKADGRITVGQELAGREVKYILLPADGDDHETA